MAPPQPSADTKPVKSQDDYINHGRDQLMAFLMTLRAIAIYGIATDWHDFDDAARVHAQDELTEAQLRDNCSDALDKIQHAVRSDLWPNRRTKLSTARVPLSVA